MIPMNFVKVELSLKMDVEEIMRLPSANATAILEGIGLVLAANATPEQKTRAAIEALGEKGGAE